MQRIKDVISFGLGTGLNYDDDLQVMPKGDGKYRLNVSIDESEKGKILAKAKGNSALKYIIDPQGSIGAWTTSTQTSPDRTRYTRSITLDYFYGYATGGLVFNILTDYKNHKVLHKTEDFSSVATACDNIQKRIMALGDPYIYAAGYTVGGSVSFYVDILDTSVSQGVRNLAFVYGELGTVNSYFGGGADKKDVVGTHYHTKDNELYIFYAADTNGYTTPYSDNLIVRYKYNEGLAEILNSTYLTIPTTIVTWKKENPIRAVVVGDDDSKVLYWTDGIHPPMNINVERAVNTTYGYYGESYSNHSTDSLKRIALNLIKQQPALACTVVGDTALSSEYSANISDKPLQFMYRYIFSDNELSSWSCVADIALNSSYEAADGNRPISSLTYTITIDPPNTTQISKVQVAYRETNLDRWKLFSTQDFDGSTNISFNITGSELVEIIDDVEANTLYDNVPLTSGVLSSINDNRLVLADNTVGQPNTTLDVTLTPVTSNYTPVLNTDALYRVDGSVDSTHHDLYIFYNGFIYLVFKTGYQEYIISLDNSAQLLSAAQKADYFVNYINTNIAPIDPYITSAANVSNNVRIEHTAGQWVHGATTVYSYYDRIMKLKNGISHNLGIVYSDEFGRKGYVNEISEQYIDFYTQQTLRTNNEYIDVLQIEINHQPPSWAHYWGIYYGDNNPKYVQLAVKVSDFTREEGKLRIKVDDIINNIKLFNPRFNMSYQYTPGDRIRWIGTIGAYVYGGSWMRRRTTLLTEYIDGQVYGYAGDFNEYLVVDDYGVFSTSKTAIEASIYVLIELYSPNKYTDAIFYNETGFKFPVLNPGTDTRYHGVTDVQSTKYGITVRDQTAVLAAVCYFDKMDHRMAQHWAFYQGTPIASFMDSQSFSNYFPSRLRNYGKPHIVNKDARQIRLNSIQWSNVFIPNSRVNGLSQFGFDDEKSMDDKYGRIVGLEVTGDILNVIQQSKLSSIYLGAELSKDAAGNDVLSYSDSILGTSHPSLEDWGSTHKYSIIKQGNYVYGFDIQSAIVWRKSHAGMEDISAYGMKNYFKTKSAALKVSGLENIIVVAGFDAFKNIYFLTFIDSYNSANNETIGFHEPSNRWISFYSFIPEMYASIENVQFLTFKNGYMYEMWTGTNCNYFGSQYGSEVWAVYNQYPTQPKIFESIQENSNAIWEMPDSHSIIVDDDAIEYTDVRDYTHHTASMQSRLKTNRFRYKHGEFHAGFLRDMGTSATQYNLMNGRKLRGKTLVCKLENSSTSNVYLRSVTVSALI